MGSAESRLQTIAWAAATLAAAAAVTAALQPVQSVRGGFAADHLPMWQRPFADGTSPGATNLTLAGVVVLLMVPPAAPFYTVRRFSMMLLALAAGLNLVLGVGFIVARQGFSEESAIWHPDAVTFVLRETPTWAVSLVTAVMLFNWRNGRGPSETEQRTEDGASTGE